MFQIEADKARNLVILIFAQHVRPGEMESGEKKAEALLAELQPGFRLLTDMTQLDVLDPGCVPFIRKNMDLFNARGISKVVRVIPDPHKDIGLNILSLFHYDRGVKIVTCATMEEAKAALEN